MYRVRANTSLCMNMNPDKSRRNHLTWLGNSILDIIQHHRRQRGLQNITLENHAFQSDKGTGEHELLQTGGSVVEVLRHYLAVGLGSGSCDRAGDRPYDRALALKETCKVYGSELEGLDRAVDGNTRLVQRLRLAVEYGDRGRAPGDGSPGYVAEASVPVELFVRRGHNVQITVGWHVGWKRRWHW